MSVQQLLLHQLHRAQLSRWLPSHGEFIFQGSHSQSSTPSSFTPSFYSWYLVSTKNLLAQWGFTQSLSGCPGASQGGQECSCSPARAGEGSSCPARQLRDAPPSAGGEALPVAVLKVWELVLQLDLSLVVAGRVPQPLGLLSKAQLVQGMGQEGGLCPGSSFLSLGATSPTALGVDTGLGLLWDRRLCGDTEGINETGEISVQGKCKDPSILPAPWAGRRAPHTWMQRRQTVLWPQGVTVGGKRRLRCSIDT